jgi:hypothetical protein
MGRNIRFTSSWEALEAIWDTAMILPRINVGTNSVEIT